MRILQLVEEMRKGKVMDKIVDLGINTRSLYVKEVDRKVRIFIPAQIVRCSSHVFRYAGNSGPASSPSDLVLC